MMKMDNRKHMQHKKQSVVTINVAPLVDVMLVLVIIFMITAPMLTVGIPVDLPKTNAQSANESKTPIIISVDRDARIYIEDTQLSRDELVAKLPLILSSGKTDVVYVRGDKNLPYGTIMEVMGVISSSGACKVSLIAEQGEIFQGSSKQFEKQRSGSNTKKRR
jgi:biopolymer transport protein TolR